MVVNRKKISQISNVFQSFLPSARDMEAKFQIPNFVSEQVIAGTGKRDGKNPVNTIFTIFTIEESNTGYHYDAWCML